MTIPLAATPATTLPNTPHSPIPAPSPAIAPRAALQAFAFVAVGPPSCCSYHASHGIKVIVTSSLSTLSYPPTPLRFTPVPLTAACVATASSALAPRAVAYLDASPPALVAQAVTPDRCPFQLPLTSCFPSRLSSPFLVALARSTTRTRRLSHVAVAERRERRGCER